MSHLRAAKPADFVETAPKPKRQRLERDSTDSESDQDSVFHEDAFGAAQAPATGSLQDEAASLTQEQLLLRRLDHLAQLTKIYKVAVAPLRMPSLHVPHRQQRCRAWHLVTQLLVASLAHAHDLTAAAWGPSSSCAVCVTLCVG